MLRPCFVLEGLTVWGHTSSFPPFLRSKMEVNCPPAKESTPTYKCTCCELIAKPRWHHYLSFSKAIPTHPVSSISLYHDSPSAHTPLTPMAENSPNSSTLFCASISIRFNCPLFGTRSPSISSQIDLPILLTNSPDPKAPTQFPNGVDISTLRSNPFTTLPCVWRQIPSEKKLKIATKIPQIQFNSRNEMILLCMHGIWPPKKNHSSFLSSHLLPSFSFSFPLLPFKLRRNWKRLQTSTNDSHVRSYSWNFCANHAKAVQMGHTSPQRANPKACWERPTEETTATLLLSLSHWRAVPHQPNPDPGRPATLTFHHRTFPGTLLGNIRSCVGRWDSSKVRQAGIHPSITVSRVTVSEEAGLRRRFV